MCLNWKCQIVYVTATNVGSSFGGFGLFSKSMEIRREMNSNSLRTCSCHGCACAKCHTDLDVYETFVKNVTKISWEKRRARTKTFHIAGTHNVELGLLCTNEDDVEELNEMYGPLCWQICDNDQRRFQKLMWYEIMKEFNCKLTSTWSNCDCDQKDGLFRPLETIFASCAFATCCWILRIFDDLIQHYVCPDMLTICTTTRSGIRSRGML